MALNLRNNFFPTLAMIVGLIVVLIVVLIVLLALAVCRLTLTRRPLAVQAALEPRRAALTARAQADA